MLNRLIVGRTTRGSWPHLPAQAVRFRIQPAENSEKFYHLG